jgi:uncharacterized membrane protein YeaQ/YmgE (transglycosylase-associated protein family)
MLTSALLSLAIASVPMPPLNTDAPPAFLRSHCTDLRAAKQVGGITQIGFGAPILLSAIGAMAGGAAISNQDDMRGVSTGLIIGGIVQAIVGSVLLHFGRNNLEASAQLVCENVPAVAMSAP